MFARRFAVIGSGALGGLYGGMLANAGAEVHFLMRSDADYVRRHGLRVDSILGDFRLNNVHVYTSADAMPVCDITILALKTTQNYQLRSLLPPVVGDSGQVLVLQNGLCPEADVAEIVGAQRVFGGVCFLCSNKIAPGHIKHLDYGRIVLGHHRPANQPPAGVTGQLQMLVDELRAARIDAVPSPDQWLARWKKLMWNIPFNGLSVVLDAKSDQLINHPEIAELAESLMREIRESALACGRDVPESAVEEMLEHTRKMVPYDSSMRLDYLAKRPLEVEAIFGTPVRAALAAGYEPKQVRMLYQQLKFLSA